MSDHKQFSVHDPFTEPLCPLPAGPEGAASASETLQEPGMEPERVLPPEDELELPTLERLEEENAVVVRGEVVQSRWKFWKRPKKRDQQLETLRQGAAEMVGLMRSIRDHLAEENGQREGLRQSLSPLPIAVESLKSMSASQADTGRVLGELRTTIEQRSERDGQFLKSLNRIGNTMSKVDETFSLMDRTLSGMDKSNQRTAKTMEKLGERVADSDRFVGETFAQLRDAEREFADHLTRSSNRNSLTMIGMCAMLVLSVVAVGFMFMENRRLLSAVQTNGALVVQVPKQVQPSEKVAIFEDLDQVDDGIDEPDREIVEHESDKDGTAPAEVVPVSGGESDLLSISRPPRRK